MAGVDIQRQLAEVGKIRLGDSTTSNSGKVRGRSLEAFRITSKGEHLIRRIAELYGGTAQLWEPQDGSAPQWEVYTTTNTLPVFAPAQEVSSWYEAWGKGANLRRCDGITEQNNNVPCLCVQEGAPADPLEASSRRACKLTTRMGFVLAKVPGLGRWGLVTHGWYAAVELRAVGDVLARLHPQVMLPGLLVLDSRERKQSVGGEIVVKKYVVPVVHFDVVTAEQINSGEDTLLAAIEQGVRQHAITSQPREAITAGPDPLMQLRLQVSQATSREQLLRLWNKGRELKICSPELRADMERRGEELAQMALTETPREPAPQPREDIRDAEEVPAPPAPVAAAPAGDVDTEYNLLFMTAGKLGMTTADVNSGLCRYAGIGSPETATAQQILSYRAHLAGGGE